MMSPSSSFWLVRALNCLQNSIILICACPSAGPTGGAGVALPAAICNFTDPVTFFAIILPNLELRGKGYPHPLRRLRRLLLHLLEFEFHRRRTPENRDHDFQGLAILIDLIDHTRKGGKGPFGDPHRLVLLELHFELGLVLRLAGFINDVLNFLFRKRRGLLSGTDKSGNPRRRLHHVPDVVIHVHFHQHIAGIEHALDGVLLATANFGNSLGSNQHAANFFFQAEGVHARLQRLFHLALKSRIRVDDVPLHVGIARLFSNRGGIVHRRRRGFRFVSVFLLVLHSENHSLHFENVRNSRSTPLPITASITKKYSPKINTATITTSVVDCTSFHEGVVTLRISVRTSL